MSASPERPARPEHEVRFSGVKIMRWKQVVVGLALTFATVAGCQQQCFLHECDWNHYHELVPPSLECDPHVPISPTVMNIATPPTVDDPDRPPRYLTLAEAIAIALEQGTVGQQSAFLSPGIASDNPLDFTGRTVVGGDSIRAFALDPAIAAADIEASLSKFDVQWNTSVSWTTTDEPAQGTNAFTNGQAAAFSTSLLKPLPTGGVAGITFSDNYQKLTNPPSSAAFPVLNPSYTPRLQFQFEQPLLLGYGVEINQLRASHPGSVLTPFPTAARVEGILITRLRFDQARAEFEKTVDFMLVNVEVAYWNLYGSYWTLYAREQAMRQAYEAWRINKARFDAGKTNIMDLYQTRQQYELFRFQRMQALGALLENERQLRGLLNLEADDGTRLIPIDAPTLTPYQPDWSTAVNEALTLRPDLVLARQDLKFRQLDLINVKNLLLPDLRFTSTYALTGLGSRLDGGDSNAFRSLASDRFTDWSVGLRLTVPLGYRDVHSQLRVARLNLARSYIVLQDQEKRAIRTLRQQYSRLVEFHHEIEIQRSQRLAAAIQLEGRFKEFLVGKGTLDILLESQRVWSQALSDEFTVIVNYNNALASFEFAKGTILQHDNAVISEGPLPQCAQVRAVAHEQERKKAIILRERQNPVLTPPCDCEKGCPGLPEIPASTAPSLPAVLEGRQPVPEITDPWIGPKPAPVLDAASSSKLSAGLPVLSSDPAAKSRPEVPQMLPLPLTARDKASGSLPAALSTGDNSFSK